MALIIKADGSDLIEVQPKNGTDFQLEELREIVGGYIEIVRVPNTDAIMVLDEEGKLKDKPFNARASVLYANPNDCIVGDVLLCKKDQVR